MGRPRRKSALAALIMATATGVLALPATASAATAANVQIQLCNDNNATLKFFLIGYNDHGDWTNSRFWSVPAHGCTMAGDYWWRTNSSVELHYVS